MKRHRFDPLSFIFGITFLAIAIVCSPWFAWSDPNSVNVTVLRWIGIGFLMLMGLILMVTSGRSRRAE